MLNGRAVVSPMGQTAPGVLLEGLLWTDTSNTCSISLAPLWPPPPPPVLGVDHQTAVEAEFVPGHAICDLFSSQKGPQVAGTDASCNYIIGKEFIHY